MNCREIYISREENKKIFVRVWDNVEKAKGVVQIFHGMSEHSNRYDDFARYLNEEGFIVYADDHRGHGNSIVTEKTFGHLGEDGFYRIVEDEAEITDLIKKEHGDLPVYIFAHSFGSFIGQEYITRYSDRIDGIMLSGSAKQDGIEIKLGGMVSKIQKRLFDDKKEAKFIDRMSFGSYNKGIKDPKNKFAWLSRDEEQVDKYIQDELCAFTSPINFYYNLFNGLNNLYKNEKLRCIRKGLPILIISGDRDPVGKYGRSVKRLYKQYVDLEIQDISLKLYEGGRHELLNEINKDEIYEYIIEWINDKNLNNIKAN